MMISTKGRYALRVMIDLAVHNDGGYIKLNDVAERQDISEKYLESIVSSLSKAGIVDSTRGKGGGYRLTKEYSDISVRDILKATEGSIAPVSCLSEDNNSCERQEICPTLSMWKDLQILIDNYFSNISLRDFLDGKFSPDSL